MYLTLEQIEELIHENQYAFKGKKYESRCFSGHHENSNDLPALALPGGDMGELAVILAASLTYGFECNILECAKILKKVVGVAKTNNFQHSVDTAAEQCRYLHLLSENPEIYSLNKESVEQLFRTLQQSELATKTGKMREDKQKESACIIFQGENGLLPHYHFKDIQGDIDARIFIYHKTLIDERRKEFSQKLYQSKAVKLFEGFTDEYLYEVLSEIGDSHLFETLHMIDSNLPIYSASYITSENLEVEKYS